MKCLYTFSLLSQYFQFCYILFFELLCVRVPYMTSTLILHPPFFSLAFLCITRPFRTLPLFAVFASRTMLLQTQVCRSLRELLRSVLINWFIIRVLPPNPRIPGLSNNIFNRMKVFFFIRIYFLSFFFYSNEGVVFGIWVEAIAADIIGIKLLFYCLSNSFLFFA